MLEMNRYIVYAILAFIWIISLGTAVPTFNFRRFNTLEFKDYTQFMCVEEFRTVDNTQDLSYKFYNYWFVLCVIIIWIPTIMMIFGYTTIWLKLRQAFKAFPYLSQQSRIARSRRKVIQMLFVLII